MLERLPFLKKAIDLMLSDVYPQVLEQENIDPYGPEIWKLSPARNPRSSNSLFPQPGNRTCDVESLKKPYEPPVVSDGDVDEYITQMRQNQANVVLLKALPRLVIWSI